MKSLLLSLFVLIVIQPVFAQQRNVDTYTCGNSLIHHIVQVNQTPTQETSTPHWMYFLAREAGNDFTISGNFMGLPYVVSQNQVPLVSAWNFDSVPNGWDSFSTPFGQSDIDNILITPMNFVQHRRPYETYQFGDTTTTPIEAADTLISWIVENKPGTPIYIYEGWPDMALYTNGAFPPNVTQWANYQSDAGFNSDFHEWFIEFHDSIVNRFPNECIKLIPVGPMISELLDQSPYNTMAIDELYEDDAPHGRPSIYFLAAMITYIATFEQRPPASYQPPSNFIHPLIINEYQNLIETMFDELVAFDYPGGESRVFCNIYENVSVESPESPLTFDVYPNPSSTSFNVKTSIVEGEIVLRNLLGSEVTKQSLGNEINVSGLPNGTYFLELYDQQNQRVGIKKVTVQ